MNLLQLFTGLVLGPLVGFAAWRAGALTNNGALAASVVGALIFGLGGWAWAAGLLTFFISSSALSRLFKSRKTGLNEKFDKGSQRDWGQVAANGGLAAALSVISLTSPETGWPWLAFLGALAAVNADTWATELGVLSRQRPILITSGRPVERGTSGGITLAGTAATVAGAALIGSIGLAFGGGFTMLAAVTLGGLAGSLFDSLLGATVQAIYFCPADQKETEQHPAHTCGNPTVHLRGWRWLNNDLVNFAASLAGAATAVSFWLLFS